METRYLQSRATNTRKGIPGIDKYEAVGRVSEREEILPLGARQRDRSNDSARS